MNRLAQLLSALLICVSAWTGVSRAAQPATFPGATWDHADPGSLGWSADKLAAARRLYETFPPASVVVVDHGRVVAEWGDPALRVKLSSIRKSFLGALIGMYAAEGKVDLDRSLGDLGVDDDPPLTPTEKTATVRMLLEARSGVYHSFLARFSADRTFLVWGVIGTCRVTTSARASRSSSSTFSTPRSTARSGERKGS